MRIKCHHMPWRWLKKVIFVVFSIVFLLVPLAYILKQYKQWDQTTYSNPVSAFKVQIGSDFNLKRSLDFGNHKMHQESITETRFNSSVSFKNVAGVIRFGRCRGKLTLALVVCGDRRSMAIVTLKSALALSLSSLHFVIFSDDENRQPVVEEILDFPSVLLKNLSFEIYPISFPNSKMATEWKKLFKLCASQRLFLPSLLGHLDALIYCDTDVIFLRPLDDLWTNFGKMNATQMAGLSPEHEDYATGWYNRFAKHPFYKPLGVNSGVMLMNLTRMRKFQWETYLEPIHYEYKLKIVWGDQDIINIIFHYHPDKLLIFGCDWNFRPDHCMYSRVCKSAERNGISVLHGNRGVFQNGKQPAFRAIFMAFQSYELNSDLNNHLLFPLKSSLMATNKTNCGRHPTTFIRQLENSISRVQNHVYTNMCNQSPVWGAP